MIFNNNLVVSSSLSLLMIMFWLGKSSIMSSKVSATSLGSFLVDLGLVLSLVF